MKAILNRTELSQLLNKSFLGVGNNKLIPVTSYIGIEIKDDKFILRSFDGLNYLELISDEAVIKNEGNGEEICVLADTLKNLIDKCTTDTITFEVEERALKITSNGEYIIDIPYEDEVPLKMKRFVINEDADKYNVKKSILKDGLSFYIEDNDITKGSSFLRGICFDKKIYSTTGYIASIINEQLSDKISHLLIDFKSIKLIDVFKDDDLILTTKDDKILFSNKERSIFLGTTLIKDDNRFPIKPMDEFLNKPSPLVGVPTSTLLSSLSRISLFMDNFRKIIRLTLNGHKLFIQATEGDSQRAKETLEITGEPVRDEVSIELKCADLQKVLTSVMDEEVYLYYGLKGMLRIETQLGNFVISLVSE